MNVWSFMNAAYLQAKISSSGCGNNSYFIFIVFAAL